MGPTYHLTGHRCPKCVSEGLTKLRSSTSDEFIKKARLVHGDKCNYNKVDYINRWKSVVIICPLHGDFEQTPNCHLAGSGCPRCKQTKGEAIIQDYLDQKGIEYLKEYKLPNTSLFCDRKYLLADFYLPKMNSIIEYNGQQHYYPISIFGGEESFLLQQERDMALRQYCKEKRIKLIEIPYNERDNISNLLNKHLKF
jgi:hypothetical protein